ncbi:patatin-like phospholipase domain-containing protein [Ditylenchus destructor]|nr:patatin-like phospholipase domain-containing protein [Ditylenchus destructor]
MTSGIWTNSLTPADICQFSEENVQKPSDRLARPNETPEGLWNREKLERLAQTNSPVGLALSGCGFLGTYHFGAMMCIQKNATNLLPRITHFTGASAGSLMAALLVLAPESVADGLIQLYELADELQKQRFGALTPGFNFARRLTYIAEKFIPEDISACQGRLFVSLTKQSDYSNRIVSEFPTRDYLLDCLMASCYIPYYSTGPFGYPPKIDGDYYIDGFYSNNLPILENIPTITISPFSGSAIITPKDVSMFDWKMTVGSQVVKVNMQNVVRGAQALFPPKRRVLNGYYELGFRNAMKFLQDSGLYEGTEGDPV